MAGVVVEEENGRRDDSFGIIFYMYLGIYTTIPKNLMMKGLEIQIGNLPLLRSDGSTHCLMLYFDPK